MTIARQIVESWLDENWDRIKDSITDEKGRLISEPPRRRSAEWIFWRAVRFYSGIDPTLSDLWGNALREWGEHLGLPASTADMLEWEECMADAMKRMARELGLNPEGARRYWQKRAYPMAFAGTGGA